MTGAFKSKFTTIKNLSDKRRLPRLGKIRLGVKALSARTGREHPAETKHFVVPDEVAKIYGNEPTTLDIMFPINDPEIVFPQARKYYGSGKGLKCIGNGEIAQRVNEHGDFEQIACPCPKSEDQHDADGKLVKRAECSQRASLMVMLPKVNLGGIYQIDIGSYNSIIDINSGIDYVRALMREALGVDRFALIPLVLQRVPRETHHDGKKQTHYTLKLTCNLTIDQLNAIKSDAKILNPPQMALPPAEEVNPAFDEGGDVEIIDEEDAQTDAPGTTTPSSTPPATEPQQADNPPPLTKTRQAHPDLAREAGRDIAQEAKTRKEQNDATQAAMNEYGELVKELATIFKTKKIRPASRLTAIVGEAAKMGDDWKSKVAFMKGKVAEYTNMEADNGE